MNSKPGSNTTRSPATGPTGRERRLPKTGTTAIPITGGALNNLSGPDPLHGDGRIALYVMGSDRENAMAKSRGLRLSGYLQDSWTIKSRLTINAGLRYDNTRGWIPDCYRERAAGIAYSVGQATMFPRSGSTRTTSSGRKASTRSSSGRSSPRAWA